MQQHKQLERALMIGRILPFEGLSLETRFIIAGATVKRSYAPQAVLVAEGETPEEAMIPIMGSVTRAGAPVRDTFDVPAVLMSRPARQAYVSGEEGCTVLALTKSHVYTLLRECPQFIEAYLGSSEGRR